MMMHIYRQAFFSDSLLKKMFTLRLTSLSRRGCKHYGEYCCCCYLLICRAVWLYLLLLVMVELPPPVLFAMLLQAIKRGGGVKVRYCRFLTLASLPSYVCFEIWRYPDLLFLLGCSFSKSLNLLSLILEPLRFLLVLYCRTKYYSSQCKLCKICMIT